MRPLRRPPATVALLARGSRRIVPALLAATMAAAAAAAAAAASASASLSVSSSASAAAAGSRTLPVVGAALGVATAAVDADGGAHAPVSDEIDVDAPDAPPGVLLLPGKRFNFDFAGGEFRIHDVPVLAFEEPNTGLGTGLTVWDGAVVLSKYLEHADLLMSLLPVLELGAGTALVGLTAAVLGSPHVILTDLPYTLPNVARSVAANALHVKGTVQVAELDWFRPAAARLELRDVQLVVGADIVWVDSLIHALVTTMKYVATAAAAPPTFLIAHQTRSRASDATFFAELDAAGFDVAPVPHTEQHPRFQDPAIAILRITLRSSPTPGAPPAAAAAVAARD